MHYKKLAVAGAIAAVAVGSWIGACVYAGYRVEAGLRALEMAPREATGGVRIGFLKHERGLFSSKGRLEASLSHDCEAGGDQAVTLLVNYGVSHFVLPTSLVRFDWQGVPMGRTANDLEEAFGPVQLSGQGTVTLVGALRTDIALPELSARQAGSALQIAPSVGFLTVKDKQLGFGWSLPRLTVRGRGQAAEVKDVVLDVDLSNRNLGTGVASLRVGQFSAGFGSIEGLSIKSEAVQDGDRLSIKLTPSVEKLQADGHTLESLVVEMGVQGLDAHSVEALTTILSGSCGLDSLTASEVQRAQQAVSTILTRGFSAGISKIAGKGSGGSIDGKATIELQPSKGGTISLAAQLRSSGQLNLTGSLLTTDQRRLALDGGVVVAQGEMLQASYEYNAGLLKVNKRTLDAGPVHEILARVDAELSRLAPTENSASVEGGARDREVVAAPQEPERVSMAESVQPERVPTAVQPVAAAADVVEAVQTPPVAASTPLASAPASLPAEVPMKECATIADCVQQSVDAGKTEDIIAIRRIASRIDSLPKPDPGNRAVARKLNASALEALKIGDAATAVQQLRQAQREDPRDVEVASNLGFALVRAGQPDEAAQVLRGALVLDPRRSSTWAPLAEALALDGHPADAQGALWVAYHWSANRDKSLAYYQERATKESRAPVQTLYARMAQVATTANSRISSDSTPK